MRILANENLPSAAVRLLRERGHEVLWVREHAPGISDSEVVKLAAAGNWLIVTFDKDFGELAFRKGLAMSCGVVLLRFSLPSPAVGAERIVSALESRNDWAGHFSVVEEGRLRMVDLGRR